MCETRLFQLFAYNAWSTLRRVKPSDVDVAHKHPPQTITTSVFVHRTQSPTHTFI